MIQLDPYSPHAAFSVFERLDPHDYREAEHARGAPCTHLQLFAEWHAAQAVGVLSKIICDPRAASPTPVAVLAIRHTGQAGVAEAAFLSVNHRKHRRTMVAAARIIHRDMPTFCDETGIRRIEARCWAEHPRAPTFLTHCGFAAEARMAGFGANGNTAFIQFAWTRNTTTGEPYVPT